MERRGGGGTENPPVSPAAGLDRLVSLSWSRRRQGGVCGVEIPSNGSGLGRKRNRRGTVGLQPVSGAGKRERAAGQPSGGGTSSRGGRETQPARPPLNQSSPVAFALPTLCSVCSPGVRPVPPLWPARVSAGISRSAIPPLRVHLRRQWESPPARSGGAGESRG